MSMLQLGYGYGVAEDDALCIPPEAPGTWCRGMGEFREDTSKF